MNESNKKKKTNYFLLCMGLGLIFGTIYNKLAIGLYLGLTIGLALDNIKE